MPVAGSYSKLHQQLCRPPLGWKQWQKPRQSWKIIMQKIGQKIWWNRQMNNLHKNRAHKKCQKIPNAHPFLHPGRLTFLEPTAITHEKKGKWSEPSLHEDMFHDNLQGWIWNGFCYYHCHLIIIIIIWLVVLTPFRGVMRLEQWKFFARVVPYYPRCVVPRSQIWGHWTYTIINPKSTWGGETPGHRDTAWYKDQGTKRPVAYQ